MSAHESVSQPSAQSAVIPSRISALRRFRPGLITDWHLRLLAIVYVRQSSPQQVREHRESRERQYALVNHAIALGWPKDRVLIIDDDQGVTGRTAEHRSGFHRIVAEVTMEHVGLILGIDMSRLARSNKDCTTCWRCVPYSGRSSRTRTVSTIHGILTIVSSWG